MLTFRYVTDLVAAVVAHPLQSLQLSFQPVVSACQCTYPAVHFATPHAVAVQWPMEANEFRVRTKDGIPFAALANQITYAGIAGGGPVGAADAAAVSDWSPIPFGSSHYVMTADAQVQYRE
jgi:hypothetical protein